MKRVKVMCVTVMAVVAGLAWQTSRHGMSGGSGGDAELTIYCAATFRQPVAEAVQAYRRQTGRNIAVRFGGSGSLAAQLEMAAGDLYLPADVSYLEPLAQRGLLRESMPLCELLPGIAVAPGNPRQITGIGDLAGKAVRVALCDRSAAIGLHLERCLGRDERWRRVEEKAVVTMATVTEVAQAVSLGVVDAGVVWDVVARQFEGVEFVALDEPQLPPAHAAVGILQASTGRSSEVKRFLELLESRASETGLLRQCGSRVSLEMAGVRGMDSR